MAKRKIIWSQVARNKLFQILDFYTEKNQSPTYSKKLYKRIIKETRLLINHPEVGKLTDEQSIRGLIIGDYVLYYEVTFDKIIIHTVWDSRQDPQKLKVK